MQAGAPQPILPGHEYNEAAPIFPLHNICGTDLPCCLKI